MPNPDEPNRDASICGTARVAMDRLAAGGGDSLAGELVLAERALVALEAAGGVAPLELADALLRVARALATLGRDGDSRRHHDRAAALYRNGQSDDQLADALYERASGLLWDERVAEAEPLLAEAADTVERGSRRHRSAGAILAAHGEALLRAGQFAEAERRYRGVLEWYQASPVACANTVRASALRDMARAQEALGRRDEADATFASALAEYRAQFGDDSTEVAAMLLVRAGALQARGDISTAVRDEADAIGIYRASIAAVRSTAPDHPAVPKWEAIIERVAAARGGV